MEFSIESFSECILDDSLLLRIKEQLLVKSKSAVSGNFLPRYCTFLFL